jgi:phosphatidylserine/phosphatidylglycerophosphate/cardiolipin synthase-like enzyme
MFEYLDHTTLNQRIVHELIPSAREFVWIATANLKDMHVHQRRGERFRPFLSVLNDLARKGVDIRVLHAAEPSQSFQHTIQRYTYLASDNVELAMCPRVHMKAVIVDGVKAYAGSANVTGAGLGEKSVHRRNFETGWLTDEPAHVDKLIELFDRIWMGAECRECGRRENCIAPIDMG